MKYWICLKCRQKVWCCDECACGNTIDANNKMAKEREKQKQQELERAVNDLKKRWR